MAGYMSFLQGWIIVHFPRLSVWGWIRDGDVRGKHLPERAEEPPWPANLEVVMEEQEARRDPNALQKP
ncbi:hypothetical protein P8452_56708 [Trifolium repens]|nr:hypothetical protein P8452_56708 [Trifolium repens]